MQQFSLSPLMAQFATATSADFDVALAESLAQPPPLRAYLDQLDADALLDWSGTSFWGMPQLREHILTCYGYHTEATTWTPAQVLVTAGSAEAIYLTMAQTLQPGDEIIVETPGWLQPQQIAPALGAKVIPWPRQEAEGWALDVTQLAALITPRTRLIYFSNPNNPTGNIANADVLADVIELACRHNLVILSDEVYRGLEWDRQTTPRLAARYARGVSVGSVSKLFGMQGLRIGWMICQDADLLGRAYTMRANTTALLNVLGERIATHALEPAHFHRTRTRQLALGRAMRASLTKIMDATDQLQWHAPQGGFLSFAHTRQASGDALAAAMLAPPHKLWVIPGSVYGYPHHIRLGLGGDPQHVAAGLQRLANFLGQTRPPATANDSTPEISTSGQPPTSPGTD